MCLQELAGRSGLQPSVSKQMQKYAFMSKFSVIQDTPVKSLLQLKSSISDTNPLVLV